MRKEEPAKEDSIELENTRDSSHATLFADFQLSRRPLEERPVRFEGDHEPV
jgi:hypothetical protein